MRTLRLGRTNLDVSAVGLGGIQFSKITPREVSQVVAAARDEGINFFETAHGYFDSEAKIGRALGKRRMGIVLASKNGAHDGLSFTEQLDSSLRRLKAERIELYQLHGVDSKEALAQALGPRGAVEAARRAIEQGKIGSLGITSHSMDICLHVLELDLFDSIQYPISLVNTEVPRSGLLKQARQKDVGLIAMKPLGGGRIDDARLALGYVYQFEGVVPVVGVETPRQVRQLAKLAARPPKLTKADTAAMEKIRKAVGKFFCRACRYCEPCPQAIAIFKVLYFPVYVKQMGQERFLASGLPDFLRKAMTCTLCRQCEQRCPFKLKIIDGMKASIELAEELMKR